jgi:GNAT superfamily N-acetyltransferase
MTPRGSFVRPDTTKEPRDGSWVVRGAQPSDVAAAAAGVEALLAELGGRPPSRPAIEAEIQALIEDEAAGGVLVAEADGEIVGLLGSSWQRAIHVPGRYVVVQDLWVDPAWRSAGVGAALIEELAELAAAQGAPRLEVGLPREDFAAIEQTTAFYRSNGFEHLGPRMRRQL